MQRTKITQLFALLIAFALLSAACGVLGSDDGSADGDVFRIAMVAPSAANDVAFTQSMVDSVNAIGETRPIEFEITDGTFLVDEAAAALRGYAEADFDLVIAHGSQYGDPLKELAPQFPDVSFAWGTAADTFDLPNVFAYTVNADEGGYVIGTIAAQMSESKIVGVVGPVEVGDAALYINGFIAGAEAQDASVTVNTAYTGSFSDARLAASVATEHIDGGADVLTGSSQMVIGATDVARLNDVAWFGTQSNQTIFSPDIVVASQVYHWEIALEQMIANIDNDTLGGEVYTLTLANGGLEIEFNDAYGLDASIRTEAEATAADLANGSLSTGL